MLRSIPVLLVAGLWLAGLEIFGVLAQGRALFLGDELARYAVAALACMVSLAVALGLSLEVCVRADRTGLRGRIAAASLGLVASGWGAWLLTEGRRVRDLTLRPLIVLGLALVATLVWVLWLRTATFVRGHASSRLQFGFSAASGVLSGLLLALDKFVLPRSYPAFHWGLFVSALAVASLGALVWSVGFSKAAERVALALAVACIGGAPFALRAVAMQPNASFAVSESAPWSGKLLGPVLAWTAQRTAEAHAPAASGGVTQVQDNAPGIDLRDRDVLLITVDALRADVLTALGGRGVAPELDRLAAESVLFRRAYTPAPHTSYALSSLLTAKFLKPVMELPGAASDHTTLPDLLRRYGYRTAAFYPPAIFFVDGARFDTLRERGFGFEYRKEMFASAEHRVGQLEAYLEEVTPGHPVFVWVHLFEPHEPYDPPPELVREDSARGRYDGEVRAADRAIGELVRRFRAQRPQGTVIITADHGEEFGEHGGSYHGTTLYDEQVRVPLLWSSPGQTRPAVVDVPVELTDVGTTLLSAAGIPREARMRGDDLGSVLAGAPAPPELYAFASVETRHMVTDGRLKAACAGEQAHCQLFDLLNDPGEHRNLAATRAADVERLRAQIGKFFASIPRAEALAIDDGARFPEALARAKLGAPGAGAEVVPLLGHARASVRAAAARVLGELSVGSALPMLDRVRTHDPDPATRAEAAIAALALGADAAAEQVVALLAEGDQNAEGLSRPRRAALALARLPHPDAWEQLAALALDASAQEAERLRATDALGALDHPQAVDPLIQLLEDVRLRTRAAEALGKLGSKRAADVLAKQLASERYEGARRAEARALIQLGDRRAPKLISRLLGMETSIPDGVRMLMELGLLAPSTGRGALMTDASVRRGSWACTEGGCVPGADAKVHLPARNRPAGQVRVTWLVHAAEASALVVNGERLLITPGEQQVSFARPRGEAAEFSIEAEGKLVVIAVVVVPAEAEIPPPSAEPWDAGTAAQGDLAN